MSKKSKSQKEIIAVLKGMIEAVKHDKFISCDVNINPELKTVYRDYVADIVATGRYTVMVNLTLQKEVSTHD